MSDSAMGLSQDSPNVTMRAEGSHSQHNETKHNGYALTKEKTLPLRNRFDSLQALTDDSPQAAKV
ncbi:hypothetical protein DY000_02042262 [Brassica cretica]|uniref:Uncharacterized protein n=1 Tax=Brassica cretica TaxID=69181 RepID=A0ABQ7BNC0_BRACR|nr:hypothetical protein DY000_02042262 [Brassica cretica]